MIGGEGWALELTHKEWFSLFHLVEDLEKEHKKLFDQLMCEESLQIELERDSWWGCLEGKKFSWSLSFIFTSDSNSGRGFEIFWTVSTAQTVTQAMRKMWNHLH